MAPRQPLCSQRGTRIALGLALLLSACGSDDPETASPARPAFPIPSPAFAIPSYGLPPTPDYAPTPTATPTLQFPAPTESGGATPTEALTPSIVPTQHGSEPAVTATPTVDRSPPMTGTSTPTLAVAPTDPSGAVLAVGAVEGVPGASVSVPVALRASGLQVVATENDIVFDPRLVTLGSCRINAAIGDRQPACESDPPDGPCKGLLRSVTDCEATGEWATGLHRLRVLILSLTNVNRIPDGVLYACTFIVAAETAGRVPLVIRDVTVAGPNGALPAAGTSGEILVRRS